MRSIDSHSVQTSDREANGDRSPSAAATALLVSGGRHKANYVPLVDPATATTVRCYLGGTLRLTFTLTAADQGTFSAAAQTYVGPYTYSDATSTFDNFHVDTP